MTVTTTSTSKAVKTHQLRTSLYVNLLSQSAVKKQRSASSRIPHLSHSILEIFERVMGHIGKNQTALPR